VNFNSPSSSVFDTILGIYFETAFAEYTGADADVALDVRFIFPSIDIVLI
jgi:hypothetical protein